MSIIDPPMNRPTIMDVARRCGLSKTTVSVILNDTPASQRVPPETRQRVRLAAEQLGYRPSWRAKVLASRRTHTIGVLYAPPMPIVVRGNYEGIIAGIHDALSERGYHMLFVPLGENPADWGSVLLDQRLDGCLVLSRLRDPLGALLKQGRLPAALVNADTDQPLPTVIADELDGARQAMRHLLELGHERMTFLLGEQPPHYSVTGRQQGYEDSMREAGHAKQIRIFTGSNEAFLESFKNDQKPPTAVLVYTHRQAVKLLQQLWDAGLSVPADVSVATFSNAYPVEDVIPPLTTVALPTEQMGRTAAELLLEQIESQGPLEPRRVVMKEQLIVRRSTAAPKR